MNESTLQARIRAGLKEAVRRVFDIDLADVSAEVPPRTEMGDLAFPVAFDLAKRLKAATGQKHNPRDIATKIKAEIDGQAVAGVSRIEIAGAGYINVFFDRATYLVDAISPATIRHEPTKAGGKLIVEHTALNPNKAAHIGHMRNAVLGDTIVRMFEAVGEQVEIQNYIDNTGVQVADVVVGFKYLENKTLDEVKAIGGKFDYYCWDLYARVGEYYEADKTRLELRTKTLHELESGEGETYELAEHISTRILNYHLDTMFRVGVEYDVLPRESEVLHLHIWKHAFKVLKERGAIEYATEGKLTGCWVMRATEEAAGSETAGSDAEQTEHEADKVIVRSNGTVTYTGKDIAFHLWKLGHLDLDFYYKPFRTYPDGRVVWITTSDPKENVSGHPRFGNGSAYFNVIDIGQSYPQHYVKVGVMAVDNDQRVARSAHVGYERVVLTPAAAEQLGQHFSEADRGRTAISMSGRKGLGVKIDDLIDQLESGALDEVAKRHPDLSDEEQRATAHTIAVGALRYYLLKYSRTSLISFDFKEALAFNGETGPYIQYSVVRANSIFRNLAEAGLAVSPEATERIGDEKMQALLSGEQGDELWSLVYLSTRLGEVLNQSVSSLEPALIAKWTFQLAQNFNGFYHNHKIISEPDPDRRALLAAITNVVRQKLVDALKLLGIEAPERM